MGTAATHAATDFAAVANNLSDLPTPATARSNLGLGSAATLNASQTATASSIAQRDAAGQLIGFVPQCRVYNSVALTVATGTNVALTFDSERADNDNLHSTTSNTSRLTAARAGLYLITGSVEWAANATGIRMAAIRLNGTTLLATTQTPPCTGGVDTAQVVSTLYQLAAGDYVELIGYQTSGGNLNVVQYQQSSPEFSMVKVG